MHGNDKEALNLFDQMQDTGMNSNHVAFIGVLEACCHAGLLNEGWQYFALMHQHYNTTATIQYCGCMVGLLGYSGCFDEAHDFINKILIEPDARCIGIIVQCL